MASTVAGFDQTETAAAQQKSEFGTLFKHMTHYLGGRVGTMLLGFVSFPIFTRLFSVEQYGQISLVLTAVALATTFAKLGLQNASYRYYDEYVTKGDSTSAGQYQSTLYLGAALLGIGAALTFLLIVAVAPGNWIQPRLRLLLGLGAGLILLRGVQSIVLSLFQAEGRTKAYNTVDVATKIAVIPSILLLALLWRTDVRAFLLGTILGEGLVLAVGTLLLQRKRRIQAGMLHWGFLGMLLAFGAPLALNELANMALNMSDRFLIQLYLGTKAVGYYSVSSNVASYVQTSLVAPLSLALGPLYMRVWATRGQSATAEFLSKLLKYYVVVAGCVVGVSIACSADALTVLASAKYRAAHDLLPALITGLMVYTIGMFLSAGLFINSQTGVMAAVGVFSCVLNIALNCAFIPLIGLQGAALARLVSYLASVAALAYFSGRHLPVRVPYLTAFKAATGAVLVLLLVRFDLGPPLLNCASRAVVGVLLYALVICVLDREVRELIFGAMSRSRNGEALL
jgi:O-antigen/teichoic acid export membrane protein